jgi:hypothetical protein
LSGPQHGQAALEGTTWRIPGSERSRSQADRHRELWRRDRDRRRLGFLLWDARLQDPRFRQRYRRRTVVREVTLGRQCSSGNLSDQRTTVHRDRRQWRQQIGNSLWRCVCGVRAAPDPQVAFVDLSVAKSNARPARRSAAVWASAMANCTCFSAAAWLHVRG